MALRCFIPEYEGIDYLKKQIAVGGDGGQARGHKDKR
jgi:hypothetical protein